MTEHQLPAHFLFGDQSQNTTLNRASAAFREHGDNQHLSQNGWEVMKYIYLVTSLRLITVRGVEATDFYSIKYLLIYYTTIVSLILLIYLT